MNFDMAEALGGRYLSKEMAGTDGLNVVISDVTKESVGEMLETKFCIHFQDGTKPMLLNKTNTSVLITLFGRNSGGWIGKRINVYNDPLVQYQGRLTGGLKIRQAKESAPASVQGLSPEELAAAAAAYRRAQEGRKTVDELADDIPF